MDDENIAPSAAAVMDAENVAPRAAPKTVVENTQPPEEKKKRSVFGNISNRNTSQAESQSVKPTVKPNDAQEEHRRPSGEVTCELRRGDESMEIDEAIQIAEIDVIEAVFELPLIEIAFREPEYNQEGLQYWKRAEKMYMPVVRYMRRQREIDWDMRSTLVDWLVEVSEEFKLCHETLYLSVAYIDRFLSIMSCTRDKLQLAGVAAMFIASKYEEIYPPTAVEFVNLTDNTYNTRQLLKLEISMLKALRFAISTPTAHSFLLHYIQTFDNLRMSTQPQLLMKLENLSQYICELTLLQGETFLCFHPSQVAAAALYVAAATLDMDTWIDGLPIKCGYSLEQLEQCIRYTHRYYTLAPKLSFTAINDKYSDPRFDQVSSIEPPRSIPLDLEIHSK